MCGRPLLFLACLGKGKAHGGILKKNIAVQSVTENIWTQDPKTPQVGYAGWVD